MSLPAGSVLLFDASQHATITLSSSPAADGGKCDTAGTMAQATSADQPTYDTLNVLGGPSLIFGARGWPNFSNPTWLAQASAAIGTPFTIAMLARLDGPGVIVEASSNVVSSKGARLCTQLGGGGPYTSIRVNGATGYLIGDALGTLWGALDQPQIAIFTSDGTFPGELSAPTGGPVLSTSSRPIIPVQLAGVAPGAISGTVPVTVGADHAGLNNVSGAISVFGIWPRTFTATDLTGFTAYCNAAWPPAVLGAVQTRNVIAIGDSITVGWYTTLVNDASTYSYNFVSRAIANLGSRFGTAKNFAVGGTRLKHTGPPDPQVFLQWTTGGGSAAIVPGIVNVVSIQGGINDMSSGETVATDLWADMSAIVSQVVSDLNGVAGGPHRVFVNNLIFAAGASYGASLTTYNGLVMSNAAALGTSNVHVHPVNVGSDSILGNQSRTSTYPSATEIYFHDTAHPNKIGHERAGAYLSAAMLAAGL